MKFNYADYAVCHKGTLLDAAEVIEYTHSRSAVVIKNRKVIGIISEGDILRALLNGVGVHAPLATFFNHSFKFLSVPDKGRALELFRNFGISLIPVVDKDFRLTDVITLNEILNDLDPLLPKR